MLLSLVSCANLCNWVTMVCDGLNELVEYNIADGRVDDDDVDGEEKKLLSTKPILC